MGVCAKILKAGDVAWKCEDCEKDPTCIICQECFEKSNHKGHRVWLKTNVGGCCDCGDIDGWEEKTTTYHVVLHMHHHGNEVDHWEETHG